LVLVWAGIIFSDELKLELMETSIAFGIPIVAAWPTLLKVFWTTLLLAISAAILSTILGLHFAVFRSFNNQVLNFFFISYVDFFPAMPIIGFMMLIYYALPLLGIRLSAIMSGILALGLSCSSYVSEIFRAGFLSVKKGQIEANHALGLNPAKIMRLVILRQAFRVVTPPLVGKYVVGAKAAALASSIFIIELLKRGLSEKSLLADSSPLIFVTVLYLIMLVPLTQFSVYLERLMKTGSRHVKL
jgi:polar amino acid transport system permease protein